MTPKSAETEPLIKETPDLEANSPGPKTRGYARALLVAVGVASLVLGGAVVAGVVKTGAEVFPPSDWLECDWAEYGRQNPDVVSTFGNDLAKMKYHYETWGWYEVRTCPPLRCDWGEYGRQNPGVVSVYGSDPANLKRHFVEYGQLEGRACPGPPECDWAKYGRQNPGVVSVYGSDPANLKLHYEEWGRAEGRTCPPLSCDWAEYGRQNPGVVSVYGSEDHRLKAHYVEHGQLEGRYCPTNAASLAACLSGNYCAEELNPSAPPAGHFCHSSVIGSKFTALASGTFSGTIDATETDGTCDDWCGKGTFNSNSISITFANGHHGRGKMTRGVGGKITITWTSFNGAQWTRDTPCRY